MTYRPYHHRSRRHSPSRRQVRGDTASTSLAGWLDAAIDGGTAATIFIAPLFLGGRDGIGRLLYVTLAMLLLFCWLLRGSLSGTVHFRHSGLEWILFAAVGLVTTQMVALPPNVLQALAPSQAEILPHFAPHSTSEPVLGSWSCLSLYPRASMQGLGVLLAHGALFLVLIHRLRSKADAERLLTWTAAAAVLMATLGLLQYFSGTEKFMWVFRHPSRLAHHAACGPFSNPNHFAHFLAMGLGALIWCLSNTWRPLESGPTANKFRCRDRRDWEHIGILSVSVALAALALAGLLSRSRGGVLMLGLAAGISVTSFLAMRRLPWTAGLGMAVVAIAVAVGLTFHGTDSLQRDLETLTAGSVDQLDHDHARRKIWSANLRVAAMFPWFGSGVGTHAEVYPLAYDAPSSVEYTHAESGYLHILTECGCCGIVLLSATILLVACWCWRGLLHGRSVELRSMAVVATTGLAVSLVHSIFDFPWFLTGCMTLTVVLAAVAWYLSASVDEHEVPRSHAVPGTSWLVATVLGGIVAVAAVCTQVGPALAATHWNRYLRISLNDDISLMPSGNHPTSGSRLSQRQVYSRLRQMAGHLKQVLRYDSGNARAHLRLATVLLKSFELLQLRSENAMALVQIRDAAISSQFPTVRQLQDWLRLALGENHKLLAAALRHARHSLELCPLQGRGYLHWSEVAFLEDPLHPPTKPLLAQAARVRPYDGAVLFAQGRDLALQGDTEGALQFWKRSFHQSAEYRDAIIHVLSRELTVEAFIKYLEPDQESIEILYRYYRRTGWDEAARFVAPMAVAGVRQRATQRQGLPAAKSWMHAYQLYTFSGDEEAALDCARKAVDCVPNHYDARELFAFALLRQGQFEAAEQQLQWCLRRRPERQRLQAALSEARQKAREARWALQADVAQDDSEQL